MLQSLLVCLEAKFALEDGLPRTRVLVVKFTTMVRSDSSVVDRTGVGICETPLPSMAYSSSKLALVGHLHL